MNPEELDWMLAVGQRVKRARIQRGLSQTELAEKAEIASTTLNGLENHGKSITLYAFYKVCKVLKKDANVLMGRRRKDPNS